MKRKDSIELIQELIDKHGVTDEKAIRLAAECFNLGSQMSKGILEETLEKLISKNEDLKDE